MRALTILLLAGCVPAENVDQTSQALFSNDKTAYDFFVAKGLTNFQSAGIVGNLDQESGVDPSAVQYGGGPGRGIAQWSVGGRWDTSSPNENAYASSKGESIWSLNLQLEFIWYELTTVGYGYAALKATTNVTDATLTFMDKYEICGTCASSQRISYAQAVLNAYGAAPNYQADFVSQTWPYASQPAFQVKCGESVPANIVLKNMGAKTWDSSTRLGTTQPRDRASIFAGSDWYSTDRAASIAGTVAPNADGKFAFSFHGPTGADCKPGTYHEFFGVVQEGVAWFSDSGEGGPPDDQIEALIELVAADPSGGTPDMAKPAAPEDGGASGGSTTGGSTGATTTTGGTGGTTGGTAGGTSGGGTTGGPDPSDPPQNGGNDLSLMRHDAPGGCSVGGRFDGGFAALFVLALWFVRRRRAI